VSAHIGQRFGNYQALSLLGEGGMGSVYLAEHPEIGRKVAIKVLRPELGRAPQLLGRFLNEARAANAIRHPNIIEILDSGTADGGTPYLVMELLEGESLGARLRRLGKLPSRMALDFAYQTASALGAAHKKGIVHRDLKPDNLFVVPDLAELGREHVKVLDFGIAKLQVQGKADSVKTRTGTLMGTPVYMSPEQCLGTKEVDHRSDIYSLGCIVFEMVCGRPPFVSEGFGELVNMHINLLPPAPRSFTPDVPQKLEDAILCALAKRPDQRFASMAELQAALREAAGASLILRGGSSPDVVRETLPAGGAIDAAPAPSPSRRTPAPPAPAVHTTTFSTGTGERRKAVARSGLRWLVVAAVGGVAAIVVGAALLVPARSRPGSGSEEAGVGTAPASHAAAGADPATARPPAAPAQAAPRRVRFVLTTDPPGADVRRTDTGESWGRTPLRRDVESSARAVDLTVEKAGFATATLSVVPDRDIDEKIALEAERAPPPGTTDPARPARPRRPRSPEPPKPQDEGPAKL
jgi:serine/threonine-protein kinase